MSRKLFVGGLPWATDDEALHEGFEKHGTLVEAKVITDRESGRSRGFGFVTYENEEDAQTALEALNGTDFGGRRIKVDFAQERAPRRDDWGGGGGGGGRGGDRW